MATDSPTAWRELPLCLGQRWWRVCYDESDLHVLNAVNGCYNITEDLFCCSVTSRKHCILGLIAGKDTLNIYSIIWYDSTSMQWLICGFFLVWYTCILNWNIIIEVYTSILIFCRFGWMCFQSVPWLRDLLEPLYDVCLYLPARI